MKSKLANNRHAVQPAGTLRHQIQDCRQTKYEFAQMLVLSMLQIHSPAGAHHCFSQLKAG